MLIDDGLRYGGCLIDSYKTKEDAIKHSQNEKVKEIRKGYMIMDNKGKPASTEIDVYWEGELDIACKDLEQLNSKLI